MNKTPIYLEQTIIHVSATEARVVIVLGKCHHIPLRKTSHVNARQCFRTRAYLESGGNFVLLYVLHQKTVHLVESKLIVEYFYAFSRSLSFTFIAI
jgi:hypothetical protein